MIVRPLVLPRQTAAVAVCVIDLHETSSSRIAWVERRPFSLELAERKAYTSARVGVRTADLLPLVQPGQPLSPLIMVSGSRYSAMGGGVPLSQRSWVVAGVGVSGGTTEQDGLVEAAMK